MKEASSLYIIVKKAINMGKNMEQKIQKIMCCCGNGVGTSLLMQMTIEEALEILNIAGVEVIFGSLADVSQEKADLFVVSEELVESLGDVPVIGLDDLMDADKAAKELQKVWQ